MAAIDAEHAARAGRAGRREWIPLALLALPGLVVGMDLTMLHLAVPSLTADLSPSPTQLLWIVDIYGFLLSGSLITMGTLGHRIGRRKLLLIGAGAFGVAERVRRGLAGRNERRPTLTRLGGHRVHGSG